MSIYGNDIKNGRVNDINCDEVADVNDLPTFAEEHDLKPGSTCLCVGNSSVYQMKSDGTWKML